MEEISTNIRRVQLEENKESFRKVLALFYKEFPHYQQQDTAQDVLFNKAYLAQGQLNDLKGDSLLNNMCRNMKQKELFLNKFSFFDPSMQLQNVFCNTAQSNLTDYIAYLKSVQSFNKKLKPFYFREAFGDDTFTMEDYKQAYPRFEPD